MTDQRTVMLDGMPVNMDEMTDLDWARLAAAQEVDRTRMNLVDEMERLGRDLLAEAGRLRDTERIDGPVGVVIQGRAHDVDRLCAVLNERREVVRMLDGLHRRAK